MAQEAQVKKLSHYWACRYRWAIAKRNDIDLEDLEQAAAVGIIRAKQAYKDEKAGFVTLAGFYARNEIRELLGIRNGQLPPIIESLDEPITDETEDTRLDLLADETLPESDAGLLELEKRQTVRDAIDRLKENQKTLVDLRFYGNRTIQQTAKEMNITPVKAGSIWESAKTNLRRDRNLLELVGRSTQYIRHVGIAQFNTTMTSSVELLVILRERLENMISQVKGQ